jgi:uncharacterized membrane protein
MYRLYGVLVSVLLATPLIAGAQNAASDVFRAEVVGIVSESQAEPLPGLTTQSFSQTIDAVVTSGDRTGERIAVENNYIPLAPGDSFIVSHALDTAGNTVYFVQDIDRRVPVLALISLCIVAIVAVAGVTGVRSLIALSASVVIITFGMVPLLLAGYPPVWTAVASAMVIVAAGMYGTHGFRSVTHAAFIGTAGTVVGAGILAYSAVALTRLSGFAADEAIYLNTATGGSIDLAGLLLGAIIIGVLGLLDDIAITQSATVAQLRGALPHATSAELYRRAMAVGRDHVGALVNTLALAYAGVSLPLLLLASRLDTPWWMFVNQEIFATEIVRTAVGGIALVLCVPLATLAAVWLVTEDENSRAHIGHHH